MKYPYRILGTAFNRLFRNDLNANFVDIQSDINNLTVTIAKMGDNNTPIKGTIEVPVFNADGSINKVQYKDSVGSIIREDAFTYDGNIITEVRTFSTGESMTFKYNLDTLSTEVI